MLKKRLLPLAMLVVSFGMVGMVQTAGVSATDPPGNNGTIKIHEANTPSGTESNDPKVCSFNIEGFSFDKDQTGTIMFDVQGGDGPTGKAAGPYNFGPTNTDGYFATQYFSLQDGHYKATLYGKDLPKDDESGATVKAKSKVFKVECGEPGKGSTTPPSTTPPTDTKTTTKSASGPTVAAAGGQGSAGAPATAPVSATAAQSEVASLPVTSGSSDKIAASVVMISSILASIGAYIARMRFGAQL